MFYAGRTGVLRRLNIFCVVHDNAIVCFLSVLRYVLGRYVLCTNINLTMNHCAILDFQTTSGNFTIKLGGSIECDGIYHHITNHLAIDACTGSLDVALDGCVVKIDIGSGNITLDNTTVTNRDVARRMNRSLKDTLDNDIGRAIQRTADIDFLCSISAL